MNGGLLALLAFVEDPGAANGVIGLGPHLAEHGVTLHLVATGAAAPFLASRGEPFEPLAASETASALLERTAARALFVGTAESPDTFAFALVEEARRRGLPSAGFVDAVSCAEHRWRGRGSDPLTYCPDQLLVCDEETEEVFVGFGVDRARIQVCGHPQFDILIARAAVLAREDRAALRQRVFPALPAETFGKTEPRVVVFCGERSTGGFDDPAFDGQFRRSADYTLHGRGTSDTRTEVIAEEVLDAVKALPQPPFTVLRFHPKNVHADFGALVDEFDATSIGGAAPDVLYAADLVVGMSSMILLEAALVGVQTLSVIARPAEREWLPALARQTTPVLATRETLRAFLAGWAASPAERRTPPVPMGAMKRLSTLVARLTKGELAGGCA